MLQVYALERPSDRVALTMMTPKNEENLQMFVYFVPIERLTDR
jgi:hypothetical protein